MELRIDKSDWVRTRLGDVCTWYQRDIPNDAQEECGIEFYVTANHIDGGEVRFNRYDSLSDGQKGPTITKHFEEGDLLLSTRSVALRKAAIAPVSGVTGEKLLVLRTSIDSNMIPDLMPFVFQSDDFWNYAQNSASGSVNKFTSWTKIREYEFLLPPKDQQAEIAELLWAVDSSIEQMQSFLEEIKTSLKTIQNELFGCGRESVALGELCQSFSGFPFKSKKMTGHGEHKLLRGINIKEGCFEWNEEIDRFYPVEEEDGRKMTSIVMELGDVVVPMDGSKLGKNYAVVDDKAEGTFLVQRIACFKVSSVLESNLLEAFFGSVFFERMVQKHNTTSAIPHISLKQLRAIDIPVINASLESTLKHYKEMRGIQALSVARLDNSKSLLQAMIASFFETHVNELNSVEHFIVHRLSGVNLNSGEVRESAAGYGPAWEYVASDNLGRELNEVLLVEELKAALVRLNPEIAAQPELADEVIYKLRAIILGVRTDGLVKANEEFHRWLVGDRTMPFGEHNRHVPVRLIDFDVVSKNRYVVTNQLRVRKQETKIPDVVLFINGLPVVVGEAKTAIRSSISWLDGATEIHEVYENAVAELFVPNILSFATEGKQLYYGGVRCPLEHWAPWRMENDPDAIARQIGLGEVGNELTDLLKPERLLDILRNFSLFSSGKGGRRIKVIPRFQQYEGANKIVERVKEGRLKKGLIWHFQGSGKSFLMVFAAQKLRRDPALKSPTVMILVDRTDLDMQITGIFDAADVSNVVSTEKIEEVRQLLERDTRKIIVSMIHKFQGAPANLNTRENIVVLVDEAHRTQEGDLGRAMRAALPNAFLFGLTGTPINKADKNTFWAFGEEEDEGGYMSRYTFHDSIRDEATLPLHFEPRLVDVHLDKDAIDTAMEVFKESADLTVEEADKLNKKSARMSAFLKSPERVEKVVADIAGHFKEKVAPHGFKAMVVTTDRFACDEYKQELDKHFPENASAVVMSTTPNDRPEFKQKYDLSGGKQEKVLEAFIDANSDLQFLIVTSKLLTGFDAPILQTMYLDKSIKDHTLLQAICRTNRKYPGKTYGRIVDYYGVFDDAAKALQFDEESMKQVISNLSVLRDELPKAMKTALAHFDGVSRDSGGFEELEAAQQKIKTDEAKDAFARDYKRLSKLWESLSPDRILDVFNADYRWLSAVFESVRPASDTIGRLLWHSHGPMTLKIMHEHTHVGEVHDLDEFVLDADVIEDIFNNPDPRNAKRLEKILVKRFQKHPGDPEFKKLSERLEALRDRAEAGLITSIEFVKELCKIARDTVATEKAKEAAAAEKTPKAALTELFQSVKTHDTPVVVERIVEDIDAFVRVVRFDGWQQSSAGEREVQSELRKVLWLKYKLRDQALFDKAYAYIKEYY